MQKVAQYKSSWTF